MWNARERLRTNSEGATFLELDRVSDALTIFNSRRRLAANSSDTNGHYDDRRDRSALQLGIRLLESPADPMQKLRRDVVIGNIIDWSKRPANTPHNAFLEGITQETHTTVKKYWVAWKLIIQI